MVTFLVLLLLALKLTGLLAISYWVVFMPLLIVFGMFIVNCILDYIKSYINIFLK